jgi:hypothetical protein
MAVEWSEWTSHSLLYDVIQQDEDQTLLALVRFQFQNKNANNK